MTAIDKILAKLEPEAGVLDLTPELYLASIAISMKRIADAVQEPNSYGEIGGAAIAGAILRGLRGS